MSISRLLFVLLTLSGFTACKSEYQQYVETEMAKGVTPDSLIFGMRLGQTKKDFFTYCWELNNKKLISQGNGNKTARYITEQDSQGNNTPKSKNMLFYGIFDSNDVMRGMEMTYSYIAWAPWNRAMQSDSLMMDLSDQYLDTYGGNEFIEIDLKGVDQKAMVKIDGSRQILMYPKGDKDVVVKIEDLNHKLKEQWKKD